MNHHENPGQGLFDDPHICQSVKDAARYIDSNPGCKGYCIALAIHVSYDHFRKAIVPVLKRHGYRNFHNRNGYFPPEPFPVPRESRTDPTDGAPAPPV